MKTMRWATMATVALVLAGAAAAAETKGRIEGVTVYRGEAMVSRLVDLAGPAGLKEVVVTDLPEQVQAASIYAESAEGLEVRSMSYRVRPVEKDVRDEVRKLDEQIQTQQDKLTAAQRQMKLLAEQRQYLEKLEQFAAPTASVELTKGVLNAQTVEQITKFQFGERKRIVEEEQRLAIEQRTLQEQVELLRRQRQQIAGSSSRLAREAVVFVNLVNPQGGKLRLRYLVGAASWTPSYNVRTDAKHQGLMIEYLADVQQMSGEDWTAVQMTLSTATPSLVAKAPVLGELAIALARPGSGGGEDLGLSLNKQAYENVKSQLKARQSEMEQRRNVNGQLFAGNNAYTGQTAVNAGALALAQPGAPNPQQAASFGQGGGGFTNIEDADNNLNTMANDRQMLDLMLRERIARGKDGKPAGRSDEGLSVTYVLKNAVSLPSRSDRQLIQIAALPMKAEFYKVASPVLTSYVYEEALVTNASQTVLLAGPVATYIDSQFVGHGAVPNVAVGETFTVGLGIDSSLRASRELVEKTESTQGGNRVVDYTYRLALENFGATPAKVRLYDRLPLAKETEIRVTLTPPATALSKEPEAEQSLQKKKIMRWDVEVPPQTAGPKALGIDYQFRLEYDRQMAIATPSASPAAPSMLKEMLLQQR